MATAFSPIFHESRYACEISSIVDSSGILIVLEMAPERNGCAAAIIFTCPVQLIDLPPPAGASEQSNTGRCSAFRYGAPSTVPCLSMCVTISLLCSGEYPSFISACGTVLFTILINPPPTSFLCFTSAKSGSIPVVSQSIMNPIVPVGASTVTCEFLYPNFSPCCSAVSHDSCAAMYSSVCTCSG